MAHNDRAIRAGGQPISVLKTATADYAAQIIAAHYVLLQNNAIRRPAL